MRRDVLKVLDAHIHSGCEDVNGYEDSGQEQRNPAVPTRNQLAEQLAEAGGRTTAVAHELRQPLFAISIANENLRQMLALPDYPRERMQQLIDRIDEQVLRAQEIMAEVLDTARDKRSLFGSSDLALALRNAICFLEPYLALSDIAVQQRPGIAAAVVPISRVRMEQVFVNVLCNAVESIQARRKQGWAGDGCIVVGVERFGDEVICTVSDNGAGVEEGIPQAAFQPFFTTKSAEGTGLGLCICQAVLEYARGDITLCAGDPEGAVVEIRLPLAPPVLPTSGPPSDIVAG